MYDTYAGNRAISSCFKYMPRVHCAYYNNRTNTFCRVLSKLPSIPLPLVFGPVTLPPPYAGYARLLLSLYICGTYGADRLVCVIFCLQ